MRPIPGRTDHAVSSVRDAAADTGPRQQRQQVEVLPPRYSVHGPGADYNMLRGHASVRFSSRRPSQSDLGSYPWSTVRPLFLGPGYLFSPVRVYAYASLSKFSILQAPLRLL